MNFKSISRSVIVTTVCGLVLSGVAVAQDKDKPYTTGEYLARLNGYYGKMTVNPKKATFATCDTSAKAEIESRLVNEYTKGKRTRCATVKADIRVQHSYVIADMRNACQATGGTLSYSVKWLPSKKDEECYFKITKMGTISTDPKTSVKTGNTIQTPMFVGDKTYGDLYASEVISATCSCEKTDLAFVEPEKNMRGGALFAAADSCKMSNAILANKAETTMMSFEKSELDVKGELGDFKQVACLADEGNAISFGYFSGEGAFTGNLDAIYSEAKELLEKMKTEETDLKE